MGSLSEMIFRLIFFIPLFCEASLRDDPVCNDPDISDECFSVCRLEYLTCRQNCSSTSCENACLVIYTDCSSTCPCGAECPAGCVDCPDHPLCKDECEDAQINNEEYKTCLNAAVFELDSCLKLCPPEIGCHNSCYENYTEQLFENLYRVQKVVPGTKNLYRVQKFSKENFQRCMRSALNMVEDSEVD